MVGEGRARDPEVATKHPTKAPRKIKLLISTSLPASTTRGFGRDGSSARRSPSPRIFGGSCPCLRPPTSAGARPVFRRASVRNVSEIYGSVSLTPPGAPDGPGVDEEGRHEREDLHHAPPKSPPIPRSAASFPLSFRISLLFCVTSHTSMPYSAASRANPSGRSRGPCAGGAPEPLAGSLKQALRWGLVPRNVSEAVDPPRVHREEISPLSPAQA